MDKYTPERTWATELVLSGDVVVADYAPILAPPQRKLFTPWPAGAATAFIRKVASGPAPDPNWFGDHRWATV